MHVFDTTQHTFNFVAKVVSFLFGLYAIVCSLDNDFHDKFDKKYPDTADATPALRTIQMTIGSLISLISGLLMIP